MKVLLLAIGLFFVQSSFAQKSKNYTGTAKVSCGQCNFKMDSKKGCDLAVQIDGKNYFVEGKTIDQFGDAHGAEGMCNKVHDANVSGKIKNGKFIAKKIELTDKKANLVEGAK